MERLSEPVSLRTLLIVVVAACALSTAIGAAVAANVIERGRAGPAGPAGAEGTRGPEGEAGAVDSEEVLTAIEAEPDRVAGVLPAADPEAAYEAIEEDPARVAEAIGDSLDPTPSELSSELDTVESDLDTVNSELTDVCSQLLLEEALTGVYSC